MTTSFEHEPGIKHQRSPEYPAREAATPGSAWLGLGRFPVLLPNSRSRDFDHLTFIHDDLDARTHLETIPGGEPMNSDPSARDLTVEEWLRYEPPEGVRTELVNGEFQMSSSVSYLHQKVLSNLMLLLVPYQAAHPETIWSIMTPARIPIPGRKDGREADVGLYAEEPKEPDSPLAWAQVKPFLAVEIVSPRNARRDYIDKWAAYHTAGIAEYWLIDLERLRFLALRWTPEMWDQTTIEGEGTYATDALPGLNLEVGRLWG